MLEPDYYFESVFEIPYDKLLEQNIRGLIFDIDNTLTAFDEEKASPKTIELLMSLHDKGFSLCLLTNNTRKRLKRFNKDLLLPGFANALKPFSCGIKKAMNEMKVEPSQTAIIGDQLFTDVWAGKRAGIATIMVKPITQRDFAFVKFKRILENRVLKKFFANLEQTE